MRRLRSHHRGRGGERARSTRDPSRSGPGARPAGQRSALAGKVLRVAPKGATQRRPRGVGRRAPVADQFTKAVGATSSGRRDVTHSSPPALGSQVSALWHAPCFDPECRRLRGELRFMRCQWSSEGEEHERRERRHYRRGRHCSPREPSRSHRTGPRKAGGRTAASRWPSTRTTRRNEVRRTSSLR